MKKGLFFFLILLSLWGVKLSYDSMQLQAKHQELQAQLQKIETRNTTLNDQVVALQRQTKPREATVTSSTADTDVQRNEMFWLNKHLELIEFSLQQYDYERSLAWLIQLDRDLPQYGLAPALQQSLHQVILKDQQQIQNFAQNRQLQQQHISQLLQQVNLLLQQASSQGPQLSTDESTEQSFIQRWFKVEKVPNLHPQLLHRSVMLKEAQLRLIVAQQLFLQGQYIQYQQELKLIHTLLNTIPDAQTNSIQKELYKIQSMEALPIPKLSTRALIGNT